MSGDASVKLIATCRRCEELFSFPSSTLISDFWISDFEWADDLALTPITWKTLRFCESCSHGRPADHWRMLLRKRALPSHTQADAPG